METSVGANNAFGNNFSAAEKKALEVAALHATVLALTMSLHNTVAEQQRNNVLRMALTTAAAKAILAGDYKESEELTKLLEKTPAPQPVGDLMSMAEDYLTKLHARLEGGKEGGKA